MEEAAVAARRDSRGSSSTTLPGVIVGVYGVFSASCFSSTITSSAISLDFEDSLAAAASANALLALETTCDVLVGTTTVLSGLFVIVSFSCDTTCTGGRG
jgi:hypothetical protein